MEASRKIGILRQPFGALCSLVLVSVACTSVGQRAAPSNAPSSSESPETPTTSQAVPDAESSPSIDADERRTFETEAFALSLKLPPGWMVEFEELNVLGLRGPTGAMTIAKVDAALDRSDPEGRLVADVGPTVNDFVAWLREHPDLTISEPSPTVIAGHSGQQFDVELTGDIQPVRPYCGGRECLAILRVTDELTPADRIALVRAARERLVLVDVDGVRVVLEFYPTAPTSLEEFIDDAQPVVDGLRFG